MSGFVNMSCEKISREIVMPADSRHIPAFFTPYPPVSEPCSAGLRAATVCGPAGEGFTSQPNPAKFRLIFPCMVYLQPVKII